MSFDRFNLDPKCLKVLSGQKITEPTPVQAEAIPPALEGRDLIAVAQTGTGKTLAFSLPALTRLAKAPGGRNRMLVLAPTRELASQVHRGIEPLARALGMRATCVYGGAGMGGQIDALRRGVDIIVATPGRLIDHLERGTVRLDKVEILVLDEADRMLDMGFMPAIRRILEGMPSQRQTLMFSATFPEDVARLTREFQRDAQRIEIGRIAAPADAVIQQLYTVDPNAKTDLLADLLATNDVQSAIVFIKTKHRTDRIAKQLSAKGISAQAIHGGRTQGQRERALDGFRRGKFRVLVATDVAARGLDVHGVSHVFNFDIPRTYDDYVHRIGRTGRASAKGNAVTFVSPEDVKELREIETGLGAAMVPEAWDGAIHVTSLFTEKQQRAHAPRPQRHGGHRHQVHRPRHPRHGGHRPGERQANGEGREQRHEQRYEQRPEQRQAAHGGQRDERREERRSEPRGEQRGDYRAERGGEQRGGHRNEQRSQRDERCHSRPQGRGEQESEWSNRRGGAGQHARPQQGEGFDKGRRKPTGPRGNGKRFSRSGPGRPGAAR